MYRFLRRLFCGRSTLDVWEEEEIQAARAAQQKSEGESPAEVYDDREWIRTRTLDSEIMDVEDMRWFKRMRAILNYEDGNATKSDLACLSVEERDRLEGMAIQARWNRFLGQQWEVNRHRR